MPTGYFVLFFVVIYFALSKKMPIYSMIWLQKIAGSWFESSVICALEYDFACYTVYELFGLDNA